MRSNTKSSNTKSSNIKQFLVICCLLLGTATPTLAAGPQPPRQANTTTPDLPPNFYQFDPQVLAASRTATKNAKLDSQLLALASTASTAPAATLARARAAGLKLDNDRVQVQIVTDPASVDAAQAAMARAGGAVSGVSLDQTLIQGWLPLTALETVAADPHVDRVRRPNSAILFEEPATGLLTTEGLAVINGAAWHNRGILGAGVKVGIIDGGFMGYQSLLGSDLPTSVTVNNFVDGELTAEVDGSSEHGTACAEIVYDIAPGASLYLAKIATDLDLQEAVTWMLQQGVQVISTSLGFYNVAPGDGTGFLADEVNRARASGIVWVTAAGNDRETHWGGPYTDADQDDLHEFNGVTEVNYFVDDFGQPLLIPAGYLAVVFLRWDDWDEPVDQDYDLLLVRWNGSAWTTFPSSGGEDFQDGSPGQTPTEVVFANTTGSATYYGFVIVRYDASRTNINFEAFAPQFAPLAQVTHARSLANLADAPDAITVAALDVNSPYPQEPYSSEGPTNGIGGVASGGGVKPDIAAFANVSTRSYGTVDRFNGTSSATPHVAGAAALVRSAYPNATTDQVRGYLGGNAIDMGAAGLDTQFGTGRLYLGSPPLRQAVFDFTGDGRSDILWRHALNGANNLWSLAGPALVTSEWMPTVSDTDWRVAAVADFTADGRVDLLWRHDTTGETIVWAMDGAAVDGFGALPTVSDTYWRVVTASDFTGDGRADILWRHATSGDNSLWAMDGASLIGFGAPPTVIDTDWHIAGVADLTGDTLADIVWRHRITGAGAVWVMNGAAVVAAEALPTVSDLGWQIVGVADYTGDGRGDILWHHAGSGVVWLWAMENATILSSAGVATVSDTNWRIACSGDYSGDGLADILWRHNGDGSTYVWVMNGPTIVDGGPLYPVGDANWQIAPADVDDVTVLAAQANRLALQEETPFSGPADLAPPQVGADGEPLAPPTSFIDSTSLPETTAGNDTAIFAPAPAPEALPGAEKGGSHIVFLSLVQR